MNRKIKKTGFTLIELLVVITIITLLISILLPVLAAARSAAQTLQCLSNERQVMLGLTLYPQDHDGYLPYGKDSEGVFWPGYLNSMYIRDGAVFLCPERLYMDSDMPGHLMSAPKNSGWWKYVSYSCNHLGAMPDADTAIRSPIRITEHRVPASKLLVFTEAYRQDRATDSHPTYGYGWFETYIPQPSYPLWTHGDVTNTAFLDGHCDSIKSIDLGWDAKAKQQDMTQLVDGWNGFPWYIGTAIH